MKSAFGSKRKARKIQVDEEEDVDATDAGRSAQIVNTRKYSEAEATDPADQEKPTNYFVVASTSSTVSNGRQTFKKSSLRQSIVFGDDEQNETETSTDDDSQNKNRPSIGRSNSTLKKKKKKKKPASSRLSFGPGEIISGDAAEALEDDEKFTSKKATLGRRVVESNAFRKSILYQGLPSGEDDEERRTYSKDYLNELKNSTPVTPKDLKGLQVNVEDEDGLDASELEGAMVVDTPEVYGPTSAAFIPSEAEIREKKERRARLAHENDFISLNDDERSGRQISLLSQKKKTETRLVREDEDIGEGFDEFVDDGRISLGKKQEREARRRQRKEMADMIHHAEGSSDDDSDDSEAERRAAYEVAQTRAGMDGLHKPGEDLKAEAVQVPARITPLPGLTECLERLRTTMSTMEQDMVQRYKNMKDLEREKNEILAREVEVQELLKQAGARYSALRADSSGATTDPQAIVDAHNRASDLMVTERGLDSIGNTPIARPKVHDIG
jgi:hypothetical protein